MGLCALRRMNAEDREQEKVCEFVRYAITSDLVKLREMITKRKMDPNAKDVSKTECPANRLREVCTVVVVGSDCLILANVALWDECGALGLELLGYSRCCALIYYGSCKAWGLNRLFDSQRRTLESSSASRN